MLSASGEKWCITCPLREKHASFRFRGFVSAEEMSAWREIHVANLTNLTNLGKLVCKKQSCYLAQIDVDPCVFPGWSESSVSQSAEGSRSCQFGSC
jgi:hypothetical protein